MLLQLFSKSKIFDLLIIPFRPEWNYGDTYHGGIAGEILHVKTTHIECLYILYLCNVVVWTTWTFPICHIPVIWPLKRWQYANNSWWPNNWFLSRTWKAAMLANGLLCNILTQKTIMYDNVKHLKAAHSICARYAIAWCMHMCMDHLVDH